MVLRGLTIKLGGKYENVLEPMNLSALPFHKKYEPLLQQDATVTSSLNISKLCLQLAATNKAVPLWGQGNLGLITPAKFTTRAA